MFERRLLVLFLRTTQHSPAVLAWATAYRNAAAITGGLLENGCVARVGFGRCLAALVCGLKRPAAWLQSAVDFSQAATSPVAAGSCLERSPHSSAPVQGCLLLCLDFLVVLEHSGWLTEAQLFYWMLIDYQDYQEAELGKGKD